MNKVLVAVGATITLTALYALMRKRSLGETSPKVSSLFLLGDSQTRGGLGEAFSAAFSEAGGQVDWFGKDGATHLHYLERPTLFDKLECADVIYIQLGDNGVPGDKSQVHELIRRIRERCPKVEKIYWGGPMKVVTPTVKSRYVSSDPSSWRYLPSYNAARREWDSRLAAWVEEVGVSYISNYSLQEAQPVDSPFSDSRKGDGLHLDKASREALSYLVRDIVLGV